MHEKTVSHLMSFFIAMILSTVVSAATATMPTTAGQSSFSWSAATGLGYDSNAYRAPRAAYTDYAPATPVAVVPQVKSGYFIPYEVAMNAGKNHQGGRVLGSASMDGSSYLGADLGNANAYHLGVRGGYEHVLTRKEKLENTFYMGALFEKHKQVYVDHDTGVSKTTTLSGTDISGRYNYTSIGVEAKYKHKLGRIDYGFSGQYVLNDYEDPVVVSQEDHGYYKLGVDASVPITAQTKLELSLDHSARDYSSRHSRDALGTLSNANPLLLYTSDALGITLRNRISSGWLLYLDYDHTQRTDGYVGYGDYRENRYGARLIYEQGRLKTRLALHHWGRDYPHGFAFDDAAQGPKTYSGNDLKFKAELEQTKHTALWTELIYKVQNTTDLRYDYVRAQIMAGVSWAY